MHWLDTVDWADEFGYVKARYRVPVKRGVRVRVFDGREGRVTSGAGNYIRVRLDGEKRSGYWHPTWEMHYLP